MTVFSSFIAVNFRSMVEIYGDFDVFNLVLASVGLSLLVLTPLSLTKKKWGVVASFFLSVILHLLIYSDVVYERYYDGILSIEMITQATQLNAVADSVFTLIQLSDIVYMAGVVGLLCLMVIVFWKWSDEPESVMN